MLLVIRRSDLTFVWNLVGLTLLARVHVQGAPCLYSRVVGRSSTCRVRAQTCSLAAAPASMTTILSCACSRSSLCFESLEYAEAASFIEVARDTLNEASVRWSSSSSTDAAFTFALVVASSSTASASCVFSLSISFVPASQSARASAS